MKKFLVVLVVVALSCMSSMAFAATEIGVSGSIDYRMRNLVNMDLNDIKSDNQNITQERVRLNIDAKAGDVKGKLSIENDWDTWSRFEATQANNTNSFLQLREAWINFNLPGLPVNVNAGHQFLQLGNAWFFRSMKFGSDAWVLANVTGNNTAAFVNIKVAENNTKLADDTDAYAFLDVYKLSDTLTAGVNVTKVSDRDGKFMTAVYAGSTGYFGGAPFVNADLQNLEAHATAAIGPAKLNAEVDMQMGDATDGGLTKHKFKGNQVVLQATIPMDALTINATVARGSGAKKADKDVKEYIALLDADPHYTVIYEYLVKTAARQHFASTHTGFGNTTAVSVGADVKATKDLMIGADLWYLQATEKVTPFVGAAATNDLGMELDAKINWKLYDNLSFNTVIGYFMPGDAYKISATKDADNARAIQSVLSFKF